MGMGPMGIVANCFVHIPNIPKIIPIFNHWDHHTNQGQRLMQWYRHYQAPPSNPRNLHEQQQHHCQQLTMSLCYQLFVHIFSCTNDQLLIIFWQNETQSKEIKIIKCMHYQCRLPNTNTSKIWCKQVSLETSKIERIKGSTRCVCRWKGMKSWDGQSLRNWRFQLTLAHFHLPLSD